MSELLAVGMSHRTAPVELRERLSVSEGPRTEEFLRELAEDAAVSEAVVISTCNRTEVYLVTGDAVEGETAALGLLARRAGIRPTELADALYVFRNCDAARHLYRVTSGLDSMIVGEAEIQGQVRRAYETALAAGATGPLSNRLFRAALATGKRVRTDTAIGASRVNVSTVAVELAREVIGDLRGRRVLVLGTGETGELTARALAQEGVSPAFVANRRRERARALADRHGGRAVGFDALPRELEEADIVVAATSSPHAIVEHDSLAEVMEARAERPLLLIDIAVPRDVDPLCASIPGVRLHDIDDLQGVVERNLSGRHEAAEAAEAIVEEEIQSFARWLGTLEVLPTVAALRARGEAIVAGVLAENAGRWERLTPRDRERVEALARTVMNRLLHEPTLRLKRSSDGREHVKMQILRELFGLEDADAAAPERASEPGDADRGPADVRSLAAHPRTRR